MRIAVSGDQCGNNGLERGVMGEDIVVWRCSK